MFMRHNTLLYLLTGQRPDGYGWEADNKPYDAMSLVSGNIDDPKKVSKQLLTLLLGGGEPHPDRLNSLLNYLITQHNQINNETVVGLLTLITAMPEYQLC